MHRRHVVVLGVGEHHAEHVALPAHQVAGVDCDLALIAGAAIADADHAPAGRQECKVGAEVHVGAHFHDEVDAAAAGQLQHLLTMRRRQVVDRVGGALSEEQAPPVVRARAADHDHAGRRCQLDGGQTHAAGGAVHQHRLAGGAASALEQGAVGRAVGHADGCALGHAQ